MKKFTNEYERFADAARSIKVGDGTGTYLGEGSESQAWLINDEGRQYVLKFANTLSPRGRQRNIAAAINNVMVVGAKAEGISGLEQLRAASPGDGVAVYDFIPGQTVDGIAAGDVSDEQVSTLLKTITEATNAGIEFDGWNITGSNGIYSPATGFTFLDFWSAAGRLTLEKNTKYALRSLGAVGLVLAERTGYRI